MQTDFAPLFRNAIGFDRLARLIDTAQAVGTTNGSSFPPYNIEKTGEDSYVLTLAVAGFGPDDIEILVQDNTLRVSGRASGQSASGELLHRGIATRAFDRRFALADHIQVEDADLVHGLLRIAVKRVVPEALKPRRIPIGQAPKQIANDGGAPAEDSQAA
ncbi:Hsp20 family protein [Acetobacteraceae bacterium KSS8]|uniref:Hsp20 family protein n=1 Tax=Endosaccharibacter trunci TaxID=2812733 RepID=A0ABT1W6H3_9PROT|nr:Hsp20 family protein [Acetobacteraceae bacterium KSS8]